MSDQLTENETSFIVDSMLLEICKLSQFCRTTICKEEYLSAQSQLDSFTSNNIKLAVTMRVKQYNYEKQPYLLEKTRTRIETLFSQLCDQFLIR
jgi:hypothetical protein